MDLGGLKSKEYLEISPQGKMPVLVCEDGAIPESDTISRWLLDKFSDKKPSFIPSASAARAKSDLICRFHDLYITTIQSAMYRAAPPYGQFTSRVEALQELAKQLQVINDYVDAKGPYLTGPDISLADATVFPTMVFVMHMLPKFSPAEVQLPTEEPGRLAGPKLAR
eukprot:749850-Hanusia_phi.AAC.4